MSRTGVPSMRSTPLKRTAAVSTLSSRTRLSPIGLTRRGPRVAKMPTCRCWARSRNGTCRRRGGRSASRGWCSQVSSHAKSNPARPSRPSAYCGSTSIRASADTFSRAWIGVCSVSVYWLRMTPMTGRGTVNGMAVIVPRLVTASLGRMWPPSPELTDHPDRLRWNARYGGNYVATFRPHPLAAEALRLALGAGPVLELAAGPSGSALLAAAAGHPVTVIDISDAGLGLLAAEASRRGVAERFALVQAGLAPWAPGAGRTGGASFSSPPGIRRHRSARRAGPAGATADAAAVAGPATSRHKLRP